MPFAQRARCRVSAVLSATFAFVAACAAPHDPARDRTVVIALAADPTLLLPPLIAETPGFVIADQILERLAEPDSTLNVIGDRAFRPRLAEAWTWASDSLSIAFRIAANARWHDGRPVTARDVRFTFAVYTDTATASPAASLLGNIDSVEARSDRVAVFWFHRRHTQQFFDATYHMRILPEHVLGDVPADSLRNTAFARAPTGSGPFRFARWMPGQFVELLTNDDYHGARAGFDRLVFSITPDPSAALERALAGEVDVVPSIRAPDAAHLSRSHTVAALRWPSLSSGLVMLDVRDPRRRVRPHAVLGDRRVRQALMMAVDRPRIAAGALGDGASPAAGPLPAPLLRGMPPLLPPFDTTAAAALLDSAGWRASGNGATRHRGAIALRFTLLVPTAATDGQRAAILIQDQLRRVGVSMDVELVDIAALASGLAHHRFDAALIALDWDPSPLSARQLWGTPNDRAGESSDFSGYHSDAFDAAIDTAASSVDSAAARRAEVRAWRTLVHDAPAIWLYDLKRIAAVRRCIRPHGVRADAWWAALANWSVADCSRRDSPP